MTLTETKCIRCNESTKFEKRGDRRCYAAVTLDSPEIDGWNESDEITWDTDVLGREILYCEQCDAELVLADGNLTFAGTTPVIRRPSRIPGPMVGDIHG